MKVFMHSLLLLLALFAGGVISVVGLRVFFWDAQFQRQITEKIIVVIDRGEKEIPVMPLFADLAGKYDEICYFADREASDPDTGENAFRKHFQGRDISLGYEDNADYSMLVTLSSGNEVKVFPFRESYIRHQGVSYFFSSVSNEHELSNWSCAVFEKAVIRLKHNSRYPSEVYLILSEAG